MRKEVSKAIGRALLGLGVLISGKALYSMGYETGKIETERKRSWVYVHDPETNTTRHYDVSEFDNDIPTKVSKWETLKTAWAMRQARKIRKKSVIQDLVNNPEDHSAHAYVENGMIKIEIRNKYHE